LIVNKGGVVIGGGKPGLPSYEVVDRMQQARPTDIPLVGARNAGFGVVALDADARQFSVWGMVRNGGWCEITAVQQRQDRLCERNCSFTDWSGIGLPL
jgi:hypothetical protein